ncbi:hypothetical protein N7456_010097 [Penicillium angulare]|uniref:Uncharacterized protein n=1 Tax=Penicillium angulare TaxID=116970 RepID=A0A9W9F5Z8_9EURO|nr:hypothetical protein N7456_010097 [Penicillium angulare]
MKSLAFLFAFLPATLASTCYWPNGDSAGENWIQCPNSVHCCAETEACLSNGLCVAGKYMTVYRGACTDKTWPIADCPRVCYEEITDSWANLYPCPSNNNEVFTCGTSGWSSGVCEAQLGNYTWVSANVTEAQVGVTISSSNSTSSNSSVTTTTSFVTVTSTHSGSGSSSNGSVALGAGLGAGLGVPLVIASAGLVWLYWRMRRQIQSLQQRLGAAETMRSVELPSRNFQAQELEAKPPPSEVASDVKPH